MVEKLTIDLILAFNRCEDKVKSYNPKLKPNLNVYISRDYKGNLDLSYNIRNDGEYGEGATVKGKDLNAVVIEFLRRCGFDQEQSGILLEAPAIEPVNVTIDDDPISF
jgi:hypothetical protein